MAEEETEKDPDQMTEEELRTQLEKHFREQKVGDVLVQFLVSLSNLAYIKMGLTEETEDIRDLAQASLAIDAFKALLDAAGKRLPEQEASALAGALSSMQITFVKVSASSSGEPIVDKGSSSAGDEIASEQPADTVQPAVTDEPAATDQPADTGKPADAGKPVDDPASRLWVPGKD
ncbi:MAG: DUF1844 domain-containing protein [Thermoleophilia bacterium]